MFRGKFFCGIQICYNFFKMDCKFVKAFNSVISILLKSRVKVTALEITFYEEGMKS
jgi:hypothetical protein